MTYSPKFQAMLNAAEARIRQTGGVAHDDFWQQLDAECADSADTVAGIAKVKSKLPRKRHRKATGEPALQTIPA